MNQPGPPSPPTKDERRPQRRTPWACDECRLRKRKCDGVEPCSPCQKSRLVCSYNFRRPAPPQTQRIHLLEVHLRYVSSFLQDAARKVPPELGIDFEGVLQKIRSVAPEDASHPADSEPGPAPVFDDVMSGEDAGASATRPRNMPGNASQQSFLLHLIELMDHGKPSSGHKASTVAALFDGPLPDKDGGPHVPIPSHDRTMRLIDGLFSSQQPVLAFLHERYFRDMVDLVYEAEAPDDGIDRFLPLLHFAIALGYLCAHQEHGTQSRNHIHDAAIRHYQAGHELLQQVEARNLIALQAVLCAGVFLISTCRLAQARPLISLASSLALELGLHDTSVDLPTEQHRIRASVLVAVLHLDLFASIILGMPPFLEAHEFDLALVDNLASESLRQGDWHTATSAAQLRLLLICNSNEVAVARLATAARDQSRYTIVDKAGAGLRDWLHHAAPLLKTLQDWPGREGLLYELEMLHSLSFLLLWRPLLLDMLSSARLNDDGRFGPADVQLALECTRLATSIRARSEEVSQHRAICPISWSGMYTVALAEVYAAALSSLRDMPAQVGIEMGPTSTGLRLLATSRCGVACAAAGLNVLKIIIRTLPEGSHVDIDDVESSMHSACECTHNEQDVREQGQSRQDDILALLNARSHETTSTSSMSRSPSSLK